jgi:hypothetical protein
LAKITIDPVFLWDDVQQRYALVSHSGQYEIPDNEILIRADRGVQSAAKGANKVATATADTFGNRATDIYGNLIPGLEQEAKHPTGFTPEEKSAQIVSSGEALGGVNSGAGGEARLNSMRTRNVSGFAPALAEAARAKGRAQAGNQLQLNLADAALARQKQEQARQQLAGLYGVNTSDMLKSMGLANEDLNTELAGGRQGWLQNTEGVINTLTGAAKAGKEIAS